MESSVNKDLDLNPKVSTKKPNFNNLLLETKRIWRHPIHKLFHQHLYKYMSHKIRRKRALFVVFVETFGGGGGYCSCLNCPFCLHYYCC